MTSQVLPQGTVDLLTLKALVPRRAGRQGAILELEDM